MRQNAALRRTAEQVERWNQTVPVGAPVTVRRDSGEVMTTRTRSEAWSICGHASVLVEGISGGYLLDRVTPIQSR